jgi:hypothetical protein
MRAGGNASPEAHTQASSVTCSLLPSLSAAVRSFDSQIALEAILLVRLLMPTKKPFCRRPSAVGNLVTNNAVR